MFAKDAVNGLVTTTLMLVDACTVWVSPLAVADSAHLKIGPRHRFPSQIGILAVGHGDRDGLGM